MMEQKIEQARNKRSGNKRGGKPPKMPNIDSVRREVAQYRSVVTIRCRDGDHLDVESDFVRILQHYIGY